MASHIYTLSLLVFPLSRNTLRFNSDALAHWSLLLSHTCPATECGLLPSSSPCIVDGAKEQLYGKLIHAQHNMLDIRRCFDLASEKRALRVFPLGTVLQGHCVALEEGLRIGQDSFDLWEYSGQVKPIDKVEMLARATFLEMMQEFSGAQLCQEWTREYVKRLVDLHIVTESCLDGVIQATEWEKSGFPGAQEDSTPSRRSSGGGRQWPVPSPMTSFSMGNSSSSSLSSTATLTNMTSDSKDYPVVV